MKNVRLARLGTTSNASTLPSWLYSLGRPGCECQRDSSPQPTFPSPPLPLSPPLCCLTMTCESPLCYLKAGGGLWFERHEVRTRGKHSPPPLPAPAGASPLPPRPPHPPPPCSPFNTARRQAIVADRASVEISTIDTTEYGRVIMMLPGKFLTVFVSALLCWRARA